MATPNPPPSYSSHDHTLHDDPPPAHVSPGTFRIGTSTIEKPVVRVAQLKGHLALLNAFADLRTQIEDLDAIAVWDLPYIHSGKEERWAWFVGLAVERFERWCLALTPWSAEESPDHALPALPLDVIMVLHSYLLNPLWFWEDCLRVPRLAGLGCWAGLLGGMLESPEVLTAPPTDLEIKQWVAMTSTPFDYLESAAVLRTRTIDCPKCSGRVEAALATADGRGYLQEKFLTICRCCSFVIGKESLAIRRICSDLISQDVSSLAGTLCTPTGVDPTRGRSIKEFMMRAPELQRPSGKYAEALGDSGWLLHMAAEVGYSFSRLRDVMAPISKARGAGLLARILNAYPDDRVFSVDLRGAVLRQGSFITKMHKLGWTEPQFFDQKEDEVALQHAIARYHAFLDLLASSPTTLVVPTLDIDLAWHTHQLTAEHYRIACMDHIGRFIDHDDKIEAGQLSSAFDATCRAWKNRFGVEYAHCGCPLPGKTIGQKLFRLVNRYTMSAHHLTPPAHDSLLAATHPSDHNAVFAARGNVFISENPQWRKWDRRRTREVREAQMGKADPKRVARGLGHDPAFLVPVPIVLAAPVPIVAVYTAPTGNVAGSGATGGTSTDRAAASACGGGDGGGDAGGDGGGDCGGGGGGGCGGGGCGGGCGGCGG